MNWTIARAAVPKDEPAAGSTVASNSRSTSKISRVDVATFLGDQLADASYECQAISISA